MSWLAWLMSIIALLLSCLGVTAEASPSASPFEESAAPSPSPSRGDEVILTEVGKASYVRASLGDRYLALPRRPRGTLVRVCGEAGCVVRRSTDVGPDRRVFPDRIADLSEADFRTVTGSEPDVVGVAVVTVEFLVEEP